MASSRKAVLLDVEISKQPMSSASSVSSGTFPESVKSKTRSFVSDHCWACLDDELLPQVCHVIAKEDSLAIRRWRGKGLIDFDLKRECNAIALCVNCHTKFDFPSDPGLVFFPEDLEFFIKCAEEDVKLQSQDPKGQRNVPTAEDYRQKQVGEGNIPEDAIGGLYRCYDLNLKPDPLLAGHRDLQQQAYQIRKDGIQRLKPWHGHPIASLRRAILVTGHDKIFRIIPQEQIDQLRRLQYLYGQLEELADMPVQIQDEDGDSQGESSGASKSKPSTKDSKSPTKKRKRADHDNEQNPNKWTRERLRSRRDQEDQDKEQYSTTGTSSTYWKCGPDTSTQDILNWLAA